MDGDSLYGEVISRYSRAQAIDDGVLVAVDSKTSREAGIGFPVAMTASVYAECVRIPKGSRSGQDEKGRMWDVLMMLRFAIKVQRGACDRILYRLKVGGRVRTLKAVCGGGDAGEPVITIMLPEED